MNESAGELDEAFVEEITGLAAMWQPQFLEHLVGLKKELLVETVEVPQIMGIELEALP
jgi:hypothetical protein